MKIIILNLIALLCCINYTNAQVGRSRLYLAIDDYSSKAKNYLKKTGNKEVKVIPGDKIYPDSPSLVNEAQANHTVLTNYITSIFPDKGATGIGVLDWEGRSFDILILNPASGTAYQNALNQFLYALKIAKSLRPNILWGYYGIPFKRGNFKTNKDWLEGNNKIAPLLKACDIFCPNLYGYNPSDLGNTSDVKNSIKLGLNYHKKVFPFIWHRYNGGDEINYRLKIIPINTFVQYAYNTANAMYEGKKADGIIWWAKDTYFYEHKEEVLLKEAPTIKSFKNYYDNILINYSNAVIKTIR